MPNPGKKIEIGKKYDTRTVLNLVPRKPNSGGERRWLTLCDCGHKSVVVTSSLVGSRSNKNCIKCFRKTAIDDMSDQEVLVLYDQCKTQVAVAKQIGVSTQVVSNRLKSIGIDTANYRYATNKIEIGDCFGLRVVLKQLQHNSGQERQWLVRCKCGLEQVVPTSGLLNHKACNRCMKEELSFSKHPNWKGYEEISGDYWNSLRRGAEQRKLDFKITMHEAWEVWQNQSGLCALTGQPIQFRKHKPKVDQTASLDRIDSYSGYHKDNVQWVHKIINRIKMHLSQKDFIDLCNQVSEHQKSIV